MHHWSASEASQIPTKESQPRLEPAGGAPDLFPRTIPFLLSEDYTVFDRNLEWLLWPGVTDIGKISLLEYNVGTLFHDLFV